MKGRCCIISVKHITDRGDRVGTEEDMRSLQQLFDKLGYCVEAHSDSKGDDVTAKVSISLYNVFSIMITLLGLHYLLSIHDGKC